MKSRLRINNTSRFYGKPILIQDKKKQALETQDWRH